MRIVTRRASERRKASSGNNYEHGTWVQIGQSHVEALEAPRTRTCYTTTAADDNLRASRRKGYKGNNRPTRDDGEGTRINRTGSRMGRVPAYGRGGVRCPAGKGGNVANRLDDAEQYWRELLRKRQEAKMTLLTAHQAFLKEDAIQKEAMVYTKKALEAQEKVDAAARLAQQREQAEADTLKEQEMSEQQAWHRLTSLRHQIVKYRTMTREQVEEMEREQLLERRMGQEERHACSSEKSSVRGCRANDGRSGQSETTVTDGRGKFKILRRRA